MVSTTKVPEDFSVSLDNWFKHNRNKTVGDLLDFFGEKSFAVLFLTFMFIPALPVPTGGITTVLLVPSTVIAALQMIFGRRSLWMPNRVTRIKINTNVLQKAIPFMIRRIRWLEKFSRPRLSAIFDVAPFRTLTGLIVLVFTLGAQFAPPFSGLDTLPAMGVVLIALAIILEDISIYIVGAIVGSLGVGLLVTAASAIILFFRHLF